MADFLEERFCELVRFGSSWQDDFAVNVVTTAGGHEYRSLLHPFPRRRFDVSYLLDREDTAAQLLAVWHRAHGQYAGFRVKCFDEWTSREVAGKPAAPTAFDQTVADVSEGVYQLCKRYGLDKSAGAAGYPSRTIWKPVAGSVKVGVTPDGMPGVEIRADDWTVDATTGRVTFDGDLTRAVTAISKAAQAVLTVGAGHPFVTGMALHVGGVAGMVQINGRRGLVTAYDATTVTLAIDSSAFSTYVGGGVLHTRPQAGETVSAGYEFDFMARFGSPLVIGQDYPNHRSADGVWLQEILQP